jgi:hypothetical protein
MHVVVQDLWNLLGVDQAGRGKQQNCEHWTGRDTEGAQWPRMKNLIETKYEEEA